jgi:ribonuclease VapC
VSSFVLDAFALMAYLQNETGASVVEAALLQHSFISIINWIEVLSKAGDLGADPKALTQDLESQGLLGQDLEIVTVTQADALKIAQLRPLTQSLGLSLGDRACIALGLRLELPVLTADRIWTSLDLGVEIQLIR